ncbi:MAG: diaminopimelate epimerase [Chloroflexota bacterium]
MGLKSLAGKEMRFVKLEGTGNDFVVVDARRKRADWASLARDMCRHHFGVGADGLIVLRRSSVADIGVSFYNADGSEAEVCGNGLRCLGKYALERGIGTGARVAVETLSGVRLLEAELDGKVVVRVKVNMGAPRFRPGEIPARVDGEGPVLDHDVQAAGREVPLSLVSMGNPHAVGFVSQPVGGYPLGEVGKQVENHPLFPQRINFEVARVIRPGKIEVRVWERGVGETLSCGSGACAVAVVARLHGYTGVQTEIILPGGVLGISWDGSHEVHLTGEVKEVFRGEWLK